MKKLDTLVSDLEGIWDLPPDTPGFSDEETEKFGKSLARAIRDRVVGKREGTRLRLSNIGKPCEKQLWYEVNKPELGEKMPPAAFLKFMYGSILEELLLWMAKVVGHKVEGEQDELDLFGVKGHRDAVIDGVTVDVKSASSYSFDKFSKHLTPDGDAFGYLSQLDAYVHTGAEDPLVTEKDIGAFLVVDKTLGHLTLDVHDRTDTEYGNIVEAKQEMLTSPTPPPRGFSDEKFQESGNRKLAVNCSYCPFKQSCWPGLKAYGYSRGPVFLTKVEREPTAPRLF